MNEIIDEYISGFEYGMNSFENIMISYGITEKVYRPTLSPSKSKSSRKVVDDNIKHFEKLIEKYQDMIDTVKDHYHEVVFGLSEGGRFVTKIEAIAFILNTVRIYKKKLYCDDAKLSSHDNVFVAATSLTLLRAAVQCIIQTSSFQAIQQLSKICHNDLMQIFNDRLYSLHIVEGPDMSGKSTMCESMAKYKYKCNIVASPLKTSLEHINRRKIIFDSFKSHTNDKKDLPDNHISNSMMLESNIVAFKEALKHLFNNGDVIMDRSMISFWAYRSMFNLSDKYILKDIEHTSILDNVVQDYFSLIQPIVNVLFITNRLFEDSRCSEDGIELSLENKNKTALLEDNFHTLAMLMSGYRLNKISLSDDFKYLVGPESVIGNDGYKIIHNCTYNTKHKLPNVSTIHSIDDYNQFIRMVEEG